MDQLKLQTRLVLPLVNETLDWFFERVLTEHYDTRRQLLSKTNEKFTTAVDYTLKKQIEKKLKYPPQSSAQWNDCYNKLRSPLRKILLIYLKLDIHHHLSRKDKTRNLQKPEVAALESIHDKLQLIPKALDFSSSTISLATGLWALDNGDTNLTISSLSNPSINLSDYFESPRDLVQVIVESLVISERPQLALFMIKIYRREDWDESYDEIYPFLLISSGQLIEAVRYERLFSNRPDYNEILSKFFELCAKRNVIKSLNRLHLNIEEEEVLNQHLVTESRSVTPSGNQVPRQKSSAKPKPRNRSIQLVQRTPSFNDSPARNTRSRKKTVD